MKDTIKAQLAKYMADEFDEHLSDGECEIIEQIVLGHYEGPRIDEFELRHQLRAQGWSWSTHKRAFTKGDSELYLCPEDGVTNVHVDLGASEPFLFGPLPILQSKLTELLKKLNVESAWKS